VTLDKIKKYDSNIDNDPSMPSHLKDVPVIREVCRAGQYLIEELDKLQCPESILVRIQWTAGKMSYGRDPWEIHHMILEKYKSDTLVFESDDSQILN
jgi:hypothetical protein